MIPLRDSIRSRRFPIINVILITFNVVIFFYEVSLGKEVEYLFKNFGIIPQHFLHTMGEGNIALVLPSLFSSMFLHGGWLHLIGNMWFLWIFGDNVEDRMGHFRFLFFYLLCGIGAALIHILVNPSSRIPTIGASGAIAGVLGAYFILYPLGKVLTLVPLGFFLTVVQLPAILFLGFWFLIQFLLGGLHSAFAPKDVGNVAWWAHVGGFISGAILIFFFKKRR